MRLMSQSVIQSVSQSVVAIPACCSIDRKNCYRHSDLWPWILVMYFFLRISNWTIHPHLSITKLYHMSSVLLDSDDQPDSGSLLLRTVDKCTKFIRPLSLATVSLHQIEHYFLALNYKKTLGKYCFFCLCTKLLEEQK